MGADGTKRLPLIQDTKWHRRFEAVGDGTPRMGVALMPRVADQRGTVRGTAWSAGASVMHGRWRKFSSDFSDRFVTARAMGKQQLQLPASATRHLPLGR